MRGIKKRFFIIISSFTFFLTYCCIYPSLAAQDEQERLKLHQSMESLQIDAEALAQELLVLDIKLRKAEQKRDFIKKELANAEEDRNQAQLQYNRALEAKQLALERIKPWLVFHYKYGYWSLMDSILGSSSLADLISRSSLVSIILGRQSKDYRAAEDAGEAFHRQEQTLKDSVEQLSRQNSLLEVQIEETKSITALRRAYLDDIKSRSSDLANRVTAIENRLLYSLDLYNLLTGAMAKIPWGSIEPDRISYGLNGITLELSENSFNRALHSGDEDLKKLWVDLQQGAFILSGKGGNTATAFTLGGALIPEENSDMVKLEIKNLNLDGIAVSGRVLEELAAGTVLHLPLPEEMKPLKISRIDITDDNFVILLN